jgi:hypothetical protein
LLTHSWLPMQVQIATFKMEENNEAQSPHWEYKLLRQLHLRGIGKGINKGDFTIPDDRVLVAVIDSCDQMIRVDSIPKDEATLADHPHHQIVNPSEELRDERFDKRSDRPFENGTLIYRDHDDGRPLKEGFYRFVDDEDRLPGIKRPKD